MREKFGENILSVKKEVSRFSIFIDQFKNPLIYILLIVTLISLALKDYIEVIPMGLVVALNVIMGFSQEYNAQKTLEALRNILKPRTVVIRDGARKEIEIKELVPEDLVVLVGGDRVPADGELIEGVKVFVNEAILTGEEEAVEKTTREEHNKLFMGTIVVAGRGIMKVTKTGKETEIGKIGESLAEIKEEKTPLQKKLEGFTKDLARIILIICLLVFLIGMLFGNNAVEMLKMAVILAVAAIPEGLPIAVTVILALGMRKILKKQGLVKKLLSIETLGTTSVICTDKTGTLTEGIMRVVKTDFTDRRKALLTLTLANDQKSNLEVALWNYVKEGGEIDPQEVFNSAERVFEVPFDSERKYALTTNRISEKDYTFVKGAPEIVLKFCAVPEEEKNKALAVVNEWADAGLKILGVAFREGKNHTEQGGFVWLGLVGIEDPLRKEAKDAISAVQKAGIKVKIVTGDYRKTAERIAINLGFKFGPQNVMEGQELEKISDDDLKKKIDDILLFVRVNPHQKLKIVHVLQEKGEIVAMTGDGVNDAPALKKADIGVVVGNGSDVAKEAGDLILLDNNFKTIVAACEEGRLIFSNIKKVVGYVLSNSFAEIFLIIGAVILNFPAPLTILQILWIHLVCDGPPDIILGFEPKEKDLMQRMPKEIKQESILGNYMKFSVFSISFSIGAVALFLFRHYQMTTGNLDLARTISFATLASVDLVYIFAFKNLRKPIIKTENFFKNKYLFLSMIYGFGLIFLAVYLPGLNSLLELEPLGLSHWILILTVSIGLTLWVELVKLFANRKKSRKIFG